MTDRFTIRTVVIALAVAVVGGVAGMGFLAMTQTPIPDQFDRIVTFLAGSLTAMLVQTGRHDEPQAVVGPDGGAVPVEEVG